MSDLQHALVGKTITRVWHHAAEIVLEFSDGTTANIQAETGMGDLAGLAWIECKVTAPKVEEQSYDPRHR